MKYKWLVVCLLVPALVVLLFVGASFYRKKILWQSDSKIVQINGTTKLFQLVNNDNKIHISVFSKEKIEEIVKRVNDRLDLRQIGRITIEIVPSMPNNPSEFAWMKDGMKVVYSGYSIREEGNNLIISMFIDLSVTKSFGWGESDVVRHYEFMFVRAFLNVFDMRTQQTNDVTINASEMIKDINEHFPMSLFTTKI